MARASKNANKLIPIQLASRRPRLPARSIKQNDKKVVRSWANDRKIVARVDQNTPKPASVNIEVE